MAAPPQRLRAGAQQGAHAPQQPQHRHAPVPRAGRQQDAAGQLPGKAEDIGQQPAAADALGAGRAGQADRPAAQPAAPAYSAGSNDDFALIEDEGDLPF